MIWHLSKIRGEIAECQATDRKPCVHRPISFQDDETEIPQLARCFPWHLPRGEVGKPFLAASSNEPLGRAILRVRLDQSQRSGSQSLRASA